AVFFTIHNEKRPSKDREVINLSSDIYWCLAASGDMVLLSDRFLNHYAKIVSIDHESQTIDLIDRWPDFHRKFIGVAPQFVTGTYGTKTAGRTLVRFSRSDFERLFVAAITIDTPDF